MHAGLRAAIFVALLPALPLDDGYATQTEESAAAGQADPWDAFPAFVWRLDNPGRPVPDELIAPFGGVNVEGPREDEWVIGEGLDFYVGHAPGRNALHIDRERPSYVALWDEYWKDRDASVLVREPCLSEGATRADLVASLRRSLAARAGARGLGVSLGDEVGLTPWGGPLDLCESKACREAFGEFLAGPGRRWGLSPTPLPYPSTDTLRKSWIEGDSQHVGAWLARREFHHRVVIDCLAALAAESRRIAPESPVGLFGQSGRSAFGDVGVEEVLPLLDFLEVYRILDARELFYTLRGPQRSVLTIFPDAEAPAGAPWLVWEHWLRGGDGVVIWSDRELASDPVYFAGTAAAVADARRLGNLLPNWRPQPAGIAIVHDPDSLALSWMRDALNDGPTWMKRYASYQNEHGTREVALRGWLRLCEDAGFLPGALPLESVGASSVERFPTLVVSEVLLLESEGLERLEAFVGAGGRLLVHGEFARYDRSGAASELNAFARLRAIAEGRVERFELDARRYLESRLSKEKKSYATRCGAHLAERLPDQPPGQPRAAGENPRWLIARQRDAERGAWIMAALPNFPGKSERSALRALDVAIVGVAAQRIEWLHPADSDPQGRVRLPAGEALVWRVLDAP